MIIKYDLPPAPRCGNSNSVGACVCVIYRGDRGIGGTHTAPELGIGHHFHDFPRSPNNFSRFPGLGRQFHTISTRFPRFPMVQDTKNLKKPKIENLNVKALKVGHQKS